MKHSIIKTVLAILCVTFSTSCKAQKLFSELSSDPDVESVYVGKAMVGLAKGAIKMSGDKDAQTAMNAILGINSIEIINCENPKSIARIRTKARKIIERLKLEVLMEAKDGKETSTFYGQPSAKTKDDFINNLVIEADEPGEYSLIHINGKIDLNALLKEQ